MERHPEVVAAAEAVRTWVLAQRATWPGFEARRATPRPTAARRATALDPALPEDTALELDVPAAGPLGTPVFTPVQPFGLGGAPDILFEPASVPAAEPGPQPKLELPPIEPTTPEPRRIQVSIPWDQLRRLAVPLAAVLALAALAGAGIKYGPALWRQQASAPKIGTLRLVSVQGPAEVLVDDAPVGTTPLELDVPVGRHTVLFRRQKATRRMNVEVVRGESTVARVDWNPKRVGALQVESTPPGAKVIIDGKGYGVTPATLEDLAVGAHTLVLESSAGTVRRRVQVAEGQTEVVNESIFPGWLRVASQVDVVVSENGRALRLDSSGRVLIAPGHHQVRLDNSALGISEVREFDVEPGATATVTLETGESTLTVTASTEAEITIDGVRVGAAPVTQGGIRVGRHEVIAVDAEGNARRRTVRVMAQPTEVHIDFSQR